MDGSIITVGDCNTQLSTMEKTTRHKINKKTEDLHFKKAEHRFFSRAYGTFSRIDHVLRP